MSLKGVFLDPFDSHVSILRHDFLRLEVTVILRLQDLQVVLHLVVRLEAIFVVEVSLKAYVFFRSTGSVFLEPQVWHSHTLVFEWIDWKLLLRRSICRWERLIDSCLIFLSQDCLPGHLISVECTSQQLLCDAAALILNLELNERLLANLRGLSPVVQVGDLIGADAAKLCYLL